eukprot:15476773-Alexandrium_andersonii.AAC.1
MCVTARQLEIKPGAGHAAITDSSHGQGLWTPPSTCSFRPLRGCFLRGTMPWAKMLSHGGFGVPS